MGEFKYCIELKVVDRRTGWLCLNVTVGDELVSFEGRDKEELIKIVEVVERAFKAGVSYRTECRVK